MDEDEISNETLKEAIELVVNIDPNDASFVALAIHLRALLWTGDKKLQKGLLSSSLIKTISTNDVYNIFLEKESQYYLRK